MKRELDILMRLGPTESSEAPAVDVADRVLNCIRHRRPAGPGLLAYMAPAVACVLAVAAAIWAVHAYTAYTDPMTDLISPVMMVMR
jgi:hypothetical protein